jgi:hypothetical protein
MPTGLRYRGILRILRINMVYQLQLYKYPPYSTGLIGYAGSHKYMKLSTKVIEGRWDENEGIWNMCVSLSLQCT